MLIFLLLLNRVLYFPPWRPEAQSLKGSGPYTYFKDKIRHLCDGETRTSFIFDCISAYIYANRLSLTSAIIWSINQGSTCLALMETSLHSKLHNKTSEGSRHVCARAKYLICNSLSTGKRGLCKCWWWNLLGCDCLWLNSQKDKHTLY